LDLSPLFWWKTVAYRIPDTHWTGGWVGRSAGQDILEKR